MEREFSMRICNIPAPSGGLDRDATRRAMRLDLCTTWHAQANDPALIRQRKRELTSGAD